MRKIDKETWERKEIYDFFSNISNPFYMTSFIVDVTKLKKFVDKNNCSFYYSLVYLCNKTLSKIENFLYTCRNNEIYLIDERMPSFTDRKPNSELFHIVSIPMSDNIVDFCKNAKELSINQKCFLDTTKENDSLAYYSCLPTLRLTALTNEMDIKNPNFKDDNIPRITWGRYEEHQGRLELTISMEVNHCFIDGIHIERFASLLESEINNLS